MASNKVSKVGDPSRGWPEGSLFDSLLHQGVGEGATPFPGLLHFTLDPYLIMLSVKQGGIKYHFWYDSTWDWTQVSRAIGELIIIVSKWMNCSIWPTAGALTGLTIRIRVDLGVIAMKGYSIFPYNFRTKAESLDTFKHSPQNTHYRSLISLDRCNWRILQPLPVGRRRIP